MIDKEQFGKRLLTLRKRAGFSQAELAERFGVSTQAVSKWETGAALPDVEIMLEISWLYDISLNGLLEGGDKFNSYAAISSAKLPEKFEGILKSKNEKRVIAALHPYFSEGELRDIALRISNGTLKCSITAEVQDDKAEYNKTVHMPMAHLSENALIEIAPAVSEALADYTGAVDRGLKRVAEYMRCPECRGKLHLQKSDDGKTTSFTCRGNHSYKVDDGVVYFNTREIQGELWSLYFRNYEHYLLEQNHPGLPVYNRGEVFSQEVKWREIEKRRPRVILDVACGTGSGIKYVMQRINWNCTVILCDLSHRVLKYNRRFFSEDMYNPYIDMVYLACDCANIPLVDNSIDCVTSHAGFESMQHKMMDGFREGYRILKQGGNAVYDISLVDDLESANTQKWVKLLLESRSSEDSAQSQKMIEIGHWLEKCSATGYKKTDAIKIYGELPAPDGDTFPYENMVLRWMAEYLCVSRK